MSSRFLLALVPAFAVAPVLAQQTNSDETLSTVIVTGEKIGRSIMETATSVNVLSARELERRAGLQTAKDILENTPNVSLVGTGNQAPTVRGVDGTGAAKGGDAFFAGSRPRLNVQIDGRPLSYNEITFGDTALWDLEQVEVLRGAQSTLQGRNAIAGTVILRTNDPTYEPEGAVRVGGGNFEQRRYSGVVSGPLSDDTAAFRLSADYLTKQTFVKGYEAFPGVDDPGDIEALNLRGKLLLEPGAIEGLRTVLTLAHSSYLNPQTETVNRPFEERRSSFIDEPVFETKTTSLIADTSYTINEQLSFEGLLAATDLGVERKATAGSGIADIDGSEYLFEPRLRFQGDAISGVAGAYLYRAQQDESIDFPSPQTFDDRVTTVAIFGEGSWPMTDSLDLIFGARYEHEKHERYGGDQTSVVISLDETYRAFLPKLGLAWHVAEDTTVGVVVSRGYSGGGAGFSFDETSGIFTNYQYDPEYATSVELFARRQALEGRLGLTANVFYSHYRDMQLSYDLTPTDSSDFAFVVRNADEAESYGAELGADWAIASGLTAYGSVGLLQARITKYPNSGFQGNDQPISPSATAAAGLSWRATQGWEASISGRYSESYYSDLDDQPRGKVDPYFVANAQLGYTLSRVRIYGYVENLFDSDKTLAVYSGAVAADDTADILPPRTYWAGVELSF